MTRFSEFIQVGLNAANSAVKARAEIEDVFEELNQELDNQFGGNVRISIKQLSELGLMGIVSSLNNPKKYSALVVHNPLSQTFSKIEIARWKQSPNGYPCWVITEGEEVACEDVESLQRELGRLLASAPVGEAILAAKASGDANAKVRPST